LHIKKSFAEGENIMAESKSLTISQVDRQNILNNALAVTEIEKHTTIDGVYYDGKIYVTKEKIGGDIIL